VRHFAPPEFWFHCRLLPEVIQDLADKSLAVLKASPKQPSLRLKKAGVLWSVRMGIGYRALGKDRPEGIVGAPKILDGACVGRETALEPPPWFPSPSIGFRT
jgi:hypothetical protein